MSANFFGLLSGGLVIASIIPYAIRVYQGKIHPNLTSWSLWTLIGLAILLTYKSSGAEDNIWPAVFGFTNPLLIMFLILRQRGKFVKPEPLEIICLAFGLISLGVWLYVREDKGMAQYALYLAILADACAAVPTMSFVWRHPDQDRPFAWGLFAIGYGLGVFAITENTFANYILPIYMTIGSLSIASILSLWRIKGRISLREWM